MYLTTILPKTGAISSHLLHFTKLNSTAIWWISSKSYNKVLESSLYLCWKSCQGRKLEQLSKSYLKLTLELQYMQIRSLLLKLPFLSFPGLLDLLTPFQHLTCKFIFKRWEIRNQNNMSMELNQTICQEMRAPCLFFFLKRASSLG